MAKISRVVVDMRKQMNQMTITVEMKHGVKFKYRWLVLLGMKFIHFGCFLAGMNYKENKE